MKKSIKQILFALALVSSSLAFAEKETIYISPNNDGVQDSLVVPLKITDNRYVTAWSLVITDSSGKIVRTIGNKYVVPYKMNVKGFFKRLMTPKQGVNIPEEVVWNGALDNGETAPDGEYFYYFTASDDNGNVAYAPNIKTTSPYKVVVDNTPPNASVKDIAQNDKIFGEGAKSLLHIKQSGSYEDEWKGLVKNASGETIKTLTWTSSDPKDFSWDGTNDNGSLVADGVYSYSVSSTDRAGNVSAPASLSNIIYSGEKPATNIVITSGKYFSPGTESPLKEISFGVTVPVPAKNSGNKLTAWNISILDSNGKTVAQFKPQNSSEIENPPAELHFDGKNDSRTVLPNGSYQASLTAKYLNGYEPPVIKSPVFVLDTTKPAAVVKASEKIFSPDGDGVKDFVTITQLITPKTGAPVKNWKGQIVDANDPANVIKEYELGEFPPDSFAWDGIDRKGVLAQDGNYKFVISATDLAGNAAAYETANFTLDTSKTEVVLSSGDVAFSPNNDRIKETITFPVVSKVKSSVASYEFIIKNENGETVRTVKGSQALPKNFVWDGKADDGIVCADGKYSAELSVNSESGSSAKAATQPFVLDTQYPKLALSTPPVPYSVFSPDGDTKKDTLSVSAYDCTNESLWTADIVDAKGKTIRSFAWNGIVGNTGKYGFNWDGTDEAGNIAPDGTYSIVIKSEDIAGNAFKSEIGNIKLDNRPASAYVISALEGISPNGDGVKDNQNFSIKTTLADGIESWNFNITDENGKIIRSWPASNETGKNLPAEIVWDGLDSNGSTADGKMSGNLSIVYTKGNEVNYTTSPFICTAIPPQLEVKTAPEFFSPDNDGVNDDLFIKLSGKTKSALTSWNFTINDSTSGRPFWTTGGTSAITEQIIWDGLSNTSKTSDGFAERVQSAMDYPFVFTATDDLGMTSSVKGVIGVDILVIRDGNVLKMAVPSIIFRSDNADFKTSAEVANGLDPEKAANNERVLKRICQILTKFNDYKVTVVGHANKVTAYEEEETEDNPAMWGPALIPLSQARADYVKNYLVEHGIKADRLATEGKGGTQLVVDWQDKVNNWKNRRVEFILMK
ncbi:MAG: OmpA family protein [Treponema sp.]|nr:OmpA family protein [Treponema sp.]